MEQAQIVVGIVKHGFNRLAFEQRAKSGRRANRKRIDDGASIAGGQLEQIDAIEKAVKAGALGIQRELGYICDFIEETVDFLGFVQINGVVGFCGWHQRNLAAWSWPYQ